MMCRGQLISALLYADDAVIFAEDEELMRRGLNILAEWCEEWSVKVNVEKCGVMHLRRKGVKRSDERFHVGGEEIKVMEEYKYLGCVVDEYLSNVRMVEERAEAGAKALNDWLRRCRATVGEVKGATFVRLELGSVSVSGNLNSTLHALTVLSRPWFAIIHMTTSSSAGARLQTVEQDDYTILCYIHESWPCLYGIITEYNRIAR